MALPRTWRALFLLLALLVFFVSCASAPRRPDKQGVRDRAEEAQRDTSRETRR